MSTTLRAAGVADQSRPVQGREDKSFGSLLRKLKLKRAPRTLNSVSNENENINTGVRSTSMNRKPRASKSIRRRQMTHLSPSTSSGLMQWLDNDCPQDLIPRILAYAGPQTISALSKTCRFWKEVVDKESTWRTLCEELYKWKEGDAIPESWRDYYKFNPCVPVDFSTVSGAFSMVRSPRVEQTRSIRVLLRPGRYVLREAITVQAPRAVRVEIETMEMPDSFLPIDQTTAAQEIEPARKRRSSHSIRNLLACRTVDVEDPEEDLGTLEFFEPSLLNSSPAESPNTSSTTNRKQATLVLRTRRHNEPVIRVRQGTAVMRNLALRHISHGIDIWNGNAAVQIQPPNGPDDQPLMVVPVPTAILEQIEITSASGRGIVNIDGGQATIRNCFVHDCAATGIYVGGPGSRAQVERTDVVRNGNGNTTHRRGIARGHSGVYLEQGHASIVDCNISQNSLTGISAVSPENAILNLEESELVSNGSFQLEMPAIGTAAQFRSSTNNNMLAAIGLPRSRSGLTEN